MGLFSKKEKSKKGDPLALQKLLHPDSPNRLTYSKQALFAQANALAAQELKELHFASERLQTTNSRGEFDHWMEDMEDALVILAKLEPFVDFKDGSPSQMLETFYNDRDQMILDFESKPNIRYFEGLEKIEAQWSVLSNLGIFTGAQADAFEAACRENVGYYHAMVADYRQKSPGYEQPAHVPAYVRLAMLYEKQGKYTDAIDVCAEAIRCGAIADGSKGKMYGRLARMIKKSGAEIPPEILQLTEPKE